MASTEIHPQSLAAAPAMARDSRWGKVPVKAVLLLALVAAAFVVRLWPLSTVHYWDETVYLQNAEVILGTRANYSELDSRPPLLSLIFAAVFVLWHKIYAADIVTALLNALGPLFLYLVGQRLFGRTTALIAALMLAFMPFFVGEGHFLLSDSPALTLLLACFWMLVEGGDRRSNRWFGGAGLMGALAVLMRFASLSTVGVLGLLCLRPKSRIAAVINFVCGFTLGLAPYLLWSRLRYGGFLATFQYGWAIVKSLSSGAGQGVGSWTRIEPASYYIRNMPAVFSWLTLAGIVLWLVFLLKREVFSREGTTVRGSIGWDLFLFAWILIVLGYYSVIGHKEQRYILPLAPPLLLLAGRGLSQLLSVRRVAVRAVAAAVLLAAFAYTCEPAFARLDQPVLSSYVSEEKDASDYLKGVAPKSAVLFSNFNYPVFAYYTGLTTRFLQQGDSFYNQFPANMPDDGYFILYRDLDLDPRSDWVDANPHFRRIHEFPSLIIYQYSAKAN